MSIHCVMCVYTDTHTHIMIMSVTYNLCKFPRKTITRKRNTNKPPYRQWIYNIYLAIFLYVCVCVCICRLDVVRIPRKYMKFVFISLQISPLKTREIKSVCTFHNLGLDLVYIVYKVLVVCTT